MTIQPCPFCGSSIGPELTLSINSLFYVQCRACKARGPTSCEGVHAEREWDKRFLPAQNPSNESIFDAIFGKDKL